MSATSQTEVTLGHELTISTTVERFGTPADDPNVQLVVRDPDGIEVPYTTTTGLQHGATTGEYYLQAVPNKIGVWTYRWTSVWAEFADEGTFEVVSVYVPPEALDLTDLRVLVPRARRYCEGPYGPPENRPPLEEGQIYAMVADACADIIMATGSLFGHKLIVKERDTRIGYPIAWATEAVLDEWEGSVIITQTALNYFFFCFRELKMSQSIKNEGTEWQYTLSVNVIRDYIATLKSQRDLAIEGLRLHHPVIDRYASNIRVRDQATVAILEWWDTNAPDAAPGLPGGQEAAVIPWTPGWSGPGFTP